MRKLKKILILLLAVAMLSQMALPVSAANKYFDDVASGIWYEDELNSIMDAQAMMGAYNIINGFEDGSFQPDGTLTRGQFLKMILESEMTSGMTLFTTDTSRNGIHWAGKYYTLALENNILVADVYSDSSPIFECTWAELEVPITRYEMAVILNNIGTNVAMGKTVIVNNPEKNITDYESIPDEFKHAVEQSYGKGLITGYEDGSFGGDEDLTRAEGVVVIYRYLFGSEMSDFAETPKVEESVSSTAPEGFQSFAQWLQSGHIDAWGNLDAEAKTRLFGSASKSYFSSSSDAANYMTTVTIPIWTMDKTGNKFSSSMPVTVHKLVEEEILYIFQEIYDDPERFPIYGGWSVGGARFTDTMRHSWGCAVDINALYNCECRMYWNSGSCTVTCGYGWWPEGTGYSAFAGSMSAPSAYSISEDSSVVRAFAKYGWGWGGQGYSVQSNGSQKFDFMHFSVMPSGG